MICGVIKKSLKLFSPHSSASCLWQNWSNFTRALQHTVERNKIKIFVNFMLLLSVFVVVVVNKLLLLTLKKIKYKNEARKRNAEWEFKLRCCCCSCVTGYLRCQLLLQLLEDDGSIINCCNICCTWLLLNYKPENITTRNWRLYHKRF